jgi:tetratricopeptide (TPR) repeat protein
LSPEGERYAEIQAGLAQTQFQHLELPAGGEFSWVEAYGNARVDPVCAHGQWEAAVGHCSAKIDELVSAAAMDEAHSAAVETMDIQPTRTVVTGNGWGALERARRIRSNLRWIDESGTPFPDASIGDEQRPWLALLDGGVFSGAEAFVAGTDWERLLSGGTQNAGTLVHRAVMRHAVGDIGPALDLYREAIAAGDTVAAHRGLALLGVDRADAAAAREHYAQACSADPANASLLIEAATTALGLDAPDDALRLIEASNGTVRKLGRVQLLRAHALAGVGRRDEATGILRAGIEVADLREGANTMAALWQQLLPEEPVPRGYQFSMTGGE